MKSKPWIWHYITCNSEFSTYPLTSCWCLFGLCWFHPLIGFPLGVGLLLSRNLSILIEIEIKFSFFVLTWENSLCGRCTKLLRVLLILLGCLFLYWSVTMHVFPWIQSPDQSTGVSYKQEKKRLAINNAKRQWEVNQGSMISRTGKLVKMPELYANHVGSIANSDIISPTNEDSLEVESIQR